MALRYVYNDGGRGRKDADGLIRPRADNERELLYWYLSGHGCYRCHRGLLGRELAREIIRRVWVPRLFG